MCNFSFFGILNQKQTAGFIGVNELAAQCIAFNLDGLYYGVSIKQLLPDIGLGAEWLWNELHQGFSWYERQYRSKHGAVAESVKHGSYVWEIVGSNQWSSQTNDL